MKLSYVKLPNEILEMNLTAKELAVLFFLSSIYASGRSSICVKQNTIAKACQIKTAKTIAGITASLSEKGLIALRRCIYEDNSTGMIYYELKLPKPSKGYFFVQRQILNEQLSPAELRVYLFICRSLSPKLGKCWNSYNDLAKLTGISRSKAIDLIAGLCAKKVIHKQKVKTLKNKRVYGDNHYTVVCYAPHRSIRKRSCGKKTRLPSCQSSPAGQSANLSVSNTFSVHNNTAEKMSCQVGGIFFSYFFERERQKKKYIHNNVIILKHKSQYHYHKKFKISPQTVKKFFKGGSPQIYGSIY